MKNNYIPTYIELLKLDWL